jgi:RHS repeat-associated protein
MRRLLTLGAFLLIAPAVLAAHPGIVQTSAAPGLGDYQYDGSGNIIQAGPRTYAYDRFGRLSSVTNGNLTEQAYTYDRHGNLLTMTTTAVNASNGTTSQTTRLGVNAKTNHLDQNSTNGVANNMVATYDAFGNIAWSPTGTFQHDQFNMPKESTVGGVRTLYLYSASDERIASIHPALSKEFWTIRDPGGRVLRRMDRTAGAWNWSQDYIYGAGRLIASAIPGTAKVLHYHADHLGTPRLITGNGGAQVGRHDYYPFGLEVPGGTTDGERLQFTGHERDAATLDYMHARYYDGSMGRFLSVDPVLDVRRALPQPQRWNRYAYAVNNPIRNVDPDGRPDNDFRCYELRDGPGPSHPRLRHDRHDHGRLLRPAAELRERSVQPGVHAAPSANTSAGFAPRRSHVFSNDCVCTGSSRRSARPTSITSLNLVVTSLSPASPSRISSLSQSSRVRLSLTERRYSCFSAINFPAYGLPGRLSHSGAPHDTVLVQS